MKRHLSEVGTGTTPAENLQASPGSLEFSSVEELLRYDASQQSPSGQLRDRLAESAKALPKRRRWWRRFLPWS